MKWTWHNKTGEPQTAIPFHLYLNAFSNLDTVFMDDTKGGQLRGDRRQSDEEAGFGYCHVIEIKDEAGISLMDGWTVDHDLAELKLPAILEPDQSISLDFYFESQLPKVFARSGYADTFHLIGQWFPKPGVFFNGTWNCWNYHGHSEFFADFGTYRAELTVPDAYLVGATGVLVDTQKKMDPKTQENLTTYTFEAEDVHDFAWTADSEFELAVEDHNGIEIRLLYLKGESQAGINDQFKAAKATFEWFDEHVGPYPFSTMTIVQPSFEGIGAAGMEYPTLVTAIPFLTPNPFLAAGAGVTIHEIGHNYWQGMLASNEFEESWMDEGINSYTEMRIFTEAYGMDMPYKLVDGLGLTPTMEKRMGYKSAPDVDPMMKRSWEFMSSSSYSINSYSRPAITLMAAQRLFGIDTMDNLLKDYYDSWSFRHPTTEDFLTVAMNVNPRLEAFLRENLYTTHTVDLSVKRLESRKRDLGGYPVDERGSIGEFETVSEDILYTHEVTLFRKGAQIPPPVDVLFVYEDGTSERRQWKPDENAWQRWKWQGESKLVFAQIDPDFKLLIDLDFTNNHKNNQEDDDARIDSVASSWLQLIVQSIFPF